MEKSIDNEVLKWYEDNINTLKECSDMKQNEREEEFEIGEIRSFNSLIFPDLFVIIGKQQENLYLTVPISSYWNTVLSSQKKLSIKLRMGNIIVDYAVIPTWDYLHETIIKNFSKKIEKITEEEIKEIITYVENFDKNNINFLEQVFLELNSKLWAPFSMGSIYMELDEIEEDEEEIW